MFSRRSLLTACGVTVFGLAMAVSVHGDTPTKLTYLTFSGPVALPGVSLPAGTYMFEQPVQEAPDVVQVRTRDRKRIYYLGFTMRVDRPSGLPANRLVTMGEAPAGQPPPIKAWFPAGYQRGYEFIYR
jgi:hypothetical protein